VSLTIALLHAVFPDGVPPRIEGLVDPAVADPLLAEFKVGPVLPTMGADRPVRVAVSDEGDVVHWAAAVRQGWPGACTEDILGLAGTAMRRMVDTDGSTKAEIYLDDLQDHDALEAAEALRQPGDMGPAMCLTSTLPSGTRSLITRHTDPPFLHLLGPLAESVADLVDQGAAGLWGLRWRLGQVVSVVWVTEARWQGTAALANEIALGLGPHAAWHRCMEVLAAQGRQGYPDAIEVLVDGTADLTLGVLPSA